jgi:hypothetical protein
MGQEPTSEFARHVCSVPTADLTTGERLSRSISGIREALAISNEIVPSHPLSFHAKLTVLEATTRRGR